MQLPYHGKLSKPENQDLADFSSDTRLQCYMQQDCDSVSLTYKFSQFWKKHLQDLLKTDFVQVKCEQNSRLHQILKVYRHPSVRVHTYILVYRLTWQRTSNAGHCRWMVGGLTRSYERRWMQMRWTAGETRETGRKHVAPTSLSSVSEIHWHLITPSIDRPTHSHIWEQAAVGVLSIL